MEKANQTAQVPPDRESKTPSDDFVILFLDVDGVLNNNWHGANALSSTINTHIEPHRLTSLSCLCCELERAGYIPRIVFSTSWRSRRSNLERLLESLSTTRVGGDDDDNEVHYLRDYVFGSDPFKDAVTPSLPRGQHGLVGGRAMEINAWIQENTQQQAQGKLPSLQRLLYLALDDLNLCFDDNGSPNPHFDSNHLLHTAEYATGCDNDYYYGEEEECVGLTPDLVAKGVNKIKEQSKARESLDKSLGGFSPSDWKLLKESGLPVSVLAKPTCPYWIRNRAELWLKEERNKQREQVQRVPEMQSCCTIL